MRCWRAWACAEYKFCVALTIRPVTAEELRPWLAMLEHGAGRRLTPETAEDAVGQYTLDRTLAAFDCGEMVGGTASDLLELTVPGGALVPAARITLASVLPTHRRRGVVSALFAHQIADLRSRGEPLAMFTTTGPGLYRRAGYNPAAAAAEVEVETAHAALDPAPQPLGALRLLDPVDHEAVLPAVFERHRPTQPGQVLRTPWFWRMWLLDRPQFRRGEPGERFAVVHTDSAGVDQGYLTYRLRPGPVRDQPVQVLVVEDLIVATDDAWRALWGYCFRFGQAVSVTAPNVPADESPAWMLADPRRLRTVRVRDFLWLRLLDVPAALTARRYAARDTIVIEVADDACPHNTGRYALEVGEDLPVCERTATRPELELRVEDLAAAYLGGVSFTALARAGRVRERRADALARCDRLFASWPRPWTVTDW